MNDDDSVDNLPENDDPVVVYRTRFLHEADMVAEAMDRAQMPHFRRVATIGGLSAAMPANPGPGLLPGSFFAIAVPGSWATRAERFVEKLPVSPEPPSSHRMPGWRDMFQGWTWVFVLAILLVLILGVIRMFMVL
jgi:hypothetical protein